MIRIEACMGIHGRNKTHGRARCMNLHKIEELIL